jgi:hypothetical protein
MVSGGKGSLQFLVWGMTNFCTDREAEQRGDGKFIVLVLFKCDQCFGLPRRTQETKNNQEVEPRAQKVSSGWPGLVSRTTIGKCPQAQEPISRWKEEGQAES